MNFATYKIKLASVISLLFLALYAFAQQQGNIVQYFGKEKVEAIKEGEVIHLFKEGLALKVPRFGFSAETIPHDPIVAKMLENEDLVFLPGESEILNGKTYQWEEISVGDKNDFNDPGLRSGYLYLEYDSPGAKTVLFEASGHTMVIVNGLPHEGRPL